MSMDPSLARDALTVSGHIRDLAKLLRRSNEADIAASGLTVAQVETLTLLYDADGLTLKELSGRLGLAHSTVSGIVDRLEKRGLVRREVDPGDRRFTRITPSQEVQAYADGLAQRPNRAMDEALARLTPEERRRILDDLALLHRVLGETAF